MKERPILFSAPMVRALLNGTKTQTRRVVKRFEVRAGMPEPEMQSLLRCCPYGAPGDRLWVRETFAKIDGQTQPWIETDYRATYTHGDRLGDSLGIKKRWTPAIHMPRAASRITLDVTGVRVERLQDISEADAVAEGIGLNEHAIGVPLTNPAGETMPRATYRVLWDSINGAGAWERNCWVWVVEFRRLP
jgi:hypothetical protein